MSVSLVTIVRKGTQHDIIEVLHVQEGDGVGKDHHQILDKSFLPVVVISTLRHQLRKQIIRNSKIISSFAVFLRPTLAAVIVSPGRSMIPMAVTVNMTWPPLSFNILVLISYKYAFEVYKYFTNKNHFSESMANSHCKYVDCIKVERPVLKGDHQVHIYWRHHPHRRDMRLCNIRCIWVILRCWGNSSMVCQQNSDAL